MDPEWRMGSGLSQFSIMDKLEEEKEEEEDQQKPIKIEFLGWREEMP